MSSVIEHVRAALGRKTTRSDTPTPPALDEQIVRLVGPDVDLLELFIRRAREMKMLVETVAEADLLPKMLAFLGESKCATAMLSDTPILQRLGAADFLASHGVRAAFWSGLTADQTYDFDAGITQADYAIAETGTLAIRHGPSHGRLLSLTPFVHVAIIEPAQILPDLIDLFAKLKSEGVGSGVTLISGPSKTADIEMNTVTGVHGPNIVKTFIVS